MTTTARTDQQPRPRTRKGLSVPAIARATLAAGVALAGLAGVLAIAPTASATPGPGPLPASVGSPRCAVPPVGGIALVDVSVATLWREPGIQRRSDRPSLRDPADLVAWNRSMRGAAARRWLVGNVQTQALYGQRVLVRDRRGRWFKVAVLDEPDSQDPRGYPGWVPKRQLCAQGDVPVVTDGSDYVVVLAKRASLHGQERTVRVGFGTRLAMADDPRTSVWTEVMSPDGPARILSSEVSAPLTPTAGSILRQGRRFLGLRYLWGGLSAWGFDCSGLIWNLFRAHGMTIPRDADPQFRSGRPISRKNLRPADLIFWGNQNYVHHVALYVGRGKMMEAPDSAGSVRIVPVRWSGYAGARRYLPKQ